MSKTALLDRAKELGIPRRTRMNEQQLQAAIVDAEKAQQAAADAEARAAAGPTPLTEKDRKLGITRRLQLIQAQVPRVMKTGEVAFKETRYSHIQEHGILAVLKPFFVAYDVGLISDVIEWQRSGNHSTLKVAYTIYCAEQPRDDASQTWGITVHFMTEGVDSTDKAMNKALTNGMKYALQKLFLIPTDQIDDVEGSDEAHNTASTSQGGGSKATDTELARLRARAASAVENELIPNNMVKAYLSSEFGTSKVTDLNGTQAVQFAAWLDQQGVPATA